MAVRVMDQCWQAAGRQFKVLWGGGRAEPLLELCRHALFATFTRGTKQRAAIRSTVCALHSFYFKHFFYL